MRSLGVDLEGAVQSIVKDIYARVDSFGHNAATLRERAAQEYGPEVAAQLTRLIEAYQGIATTVLHFSMDSPRYGLLKDRQEDGSFVIVL
jgi:hypothetical protein